MTEAWEDVTAEDMLTAWATPARIANDFVGLITSALACSPFGVPTLSEECAGEVAEAVKFIAPGPTLATQCCGAVVVCVRRFYWHDGNLGEVNQPGQMVGEFGGWAAEISAAVLRPTPTLGAWGGLPIQGGQTPVGDLSAAVLSDVATVLMSDGLAMMLAQEVCFGRDPTDRLSVHETARPKWVPGAVNRIGHGFNCSGNAIGWGSARPIRVHLNRKYLPCIDDCVAFDSYLNP